MHYFELFQLPVHFSVDLSHLENNYFELQQRFHPDRFAGRAESEKLLAVKQSSIVNDAYAILKNPLKRAEYILKLQDILVNHDSRDAHSPSPMLLMEMMELRERLAECDSPKARASFCDDVAQLIADTLQAVSDAFDNEDYPLAADLTTKLQYLYKTNGEAKRLAR